MGHSTHEKSNHQSGCSCSKCCGFFCGFVIMDDCREDGDSNLGQSGDEEALFCTLCNAEVIFFKPVAYPMTIDACVSA